MDRGRAERLLCDYREGTLDAAQRDELEAYLAGDEECRRLLAALDELADTLSGLSAPAPAPELARRVARAALTARRAAVVLPFRSTLPALLQAAAAVAMLVTGSAGLLAGPEAGPSRAASRIVQRTGLELREQRDRLVENLRVLRVLVGSAFESRLDRIEERVEDYRELLEERSRTGIEPARIEGRRPHPGGTPRGGRTERVELTAPHRRNTDSTTAPEFPFVEPRRRS